MLANLFHKGEGHLRHAVKVSSGTDDRHVGLFVQVFN